MTTPISIASLGFVLKKEKLASLKTPVDYNVFILETILPYPGYYSPQNIPSWSAGPKKKSVYMLIKPLECCNEEYITRKTQEIQQKSKIKPEASPGTLRIGNKEYSCIRMRLDSTFLIPEIIKKYCDKGITFLKKRNLDQMDCMIKVQKFFIMEQQKEGVYQDKEDSNIFYLQMPHDIPWDNFEETTMRIKNTLSISGFDAALANIYYKNGFIDFIRIYAPDRTVFDMEKLRMK
ncbi:MAG: hypothetical protein ACOC31_04380, partial [Bacteroidota bacterium]